MNRGVSQWIRRWLGGTRNNRAMNLFTLDGLETVSSILSGAGGLPEPKSRRLCGLSVLQEAAGKGVPGRGPCPSAAKAVFTTMHLPQR